MNQEQAGQALPLPDRLPQRINEGMAVYDRDSQVVGTIQVVYFGGASEEAIQRAVHAEEGANRYVRPEQIDEGVFSEEIEGALTDVLRLRVTRGDLLNN